LGTHWGSPAPPLIGLSYLCSMVLDEGCRILVCLTQRPLHACTTVRRFPFPYLSIVNPLQRFVGAEDQASNKPADMLKSFPPTKDSSKTFHPLEPMVSGTQVIGSMTSFYFSITHTHLYSSTIHALFPITFQVVLKPVRAIDVAPTRTCKSVSTRIHL